MKKSTLIKLVKEELSKKKLLKENNLAAEISELLTDGQNYREFAKAVAQVLEKDYGTHNYQPFMEVLRSELKLEENLKENESNGGVLNKQQLIAKLQQLQKEAPAQRVHIPRAYDSGAYDKTGARLYATPEQAIASLQNADEGEFTQDSHDERSFSLVIPKDESDRIEKMMDLMGSKD